MPIRGSVDILLDKTVNNKDVFKDKSERQVQTGDHGQSQRIQEDRNTWFLQKHIVFLFACEMQVKLPFKEQACSSHL